MHSFNSATHLEPEAAETVVETAAVVVPEELARAEEHRPPEVAAEVPLPAAQVKAANLHSAVCLLEGLPVIYSASAAST